MRPQICMAREEGTRGKCQHTASFLVQGRIWSAIHTLPGLRALGNAVEDLPCMPAETAHSNQL